MFKFKLKVIRIEMVVKHCLLSDLASFDFEKLSKSMLSISLVFNYTTKLDISLKIHITNLIASCRRFSFKALNLA